MGKPRVTTRCVANRYSGKNERIIEFGAGTKGAGGLISFKYDPDTDEIHVDVYRMERVIVREGSKRG